MPSAELNGTSISYDTVGSGPLCLVMHGGLGIDHTLYRPALDFLAQRFTAVYYDHRCNGRSGRPPLDTLTMEQLADDAAALVEHLGVSTAAVVGHSYGGFVAQELALRHRDIVSALVLVGTTPGQLGTGERPRTEKVPPTPPELLEVLQSSPSSDEEYAQMMRRLLGLYLHRVDPSELEPVLAETIFDARSMMRSMEVLGSWSSVDRLASVTAPTLLCVGRHDVATSWPQSLRIAERVPGAEMVIFEDSGHMPFLDEPDRFRHVVEGWLDTLSGRSTPAKATRS